MNKHEKTNETKSEHQKNHSEKNQTEKKSEQAHQNQHKNHESSHHKTHAPIDSKVKDETKTTKSQEDQKRDQLINSIKSIFASKTNSSENKENNTNLSKEEKKRQELITKAKPFFPYLLLAIIVYLGSFIRVQSLAQLKDAVTGKWIPLALDPYLFYRYAHYIQENGSLFVHDAGRFIPEGISTIEHIFKTTFMVYLHKIISIFAPNTGLDFAIVIYPVICFAIALIFFYMLNKELFDTKTALLATAFLAVVPAFLQRTMAGFSDHEALGIMFFFIAMWFFIKTIKSTKNSESNKINKSKLLYALGTGISTGLMGQSWGGWKFLILIISGYTLIQFFLNTTTKQDIYAYIIWIISTIAIVSFWIPVYTIGELIRSFTTGIAFLTLGVLIIELLFQTDYLKNLIKPLEQKIPHSILIFIIATGLGGIFLLITGNLAEVLGQTGEIWESLLRPLGKNRWELTVAEQHQPYFTQWMGEFGPRLFNISTLPIYLTLFMTGSVMLFHKLVNNLKQKWVLTTAYTMFIIAFTMSRYSPNSTFNGVNTISTVAYIGSLITFALFIAGFYIYLFYKDQDTLNKIKDLKKEYIAVIIWFVLLVVGARGAIRLLFMFAPITAVLAAHATITLWQKATKINNTYYKAIAIAAIIFIIASPFAAPMKGVIPTFYENSFNQARYTGTGYNQQWQTAGQWVQENIPEDAVFSHWWDYGYWIQTGWGRDTILDGTNKITYWNYLMGRHVMTGQNQEEALEWLKVHKATHFLVISDEIGKYTAYSSIGSNEDYDRYSYITTFGLDESLATETRDGTTIVYTGTYVLDDDFVYQNKLYPQGAAGIGAIFVPITQAANTENSDTIEVQIEQPYAGVIYNGQQIEIPIECLYMNGQMNWYDEPGLGGCVTIIPTVTTDGQVANDIGAALYVSKEGVNALWTNLYIFDGNNPRYDTSAFVNVFDQSSTWAPLSLLLGHNRIIGPIKIWEINYPEGFEVDPELEEQYLGGNENLPDFFYDVS